MAKRFCTVFFCGLLGHVTADAQLVNNGEKIFIDKDALVVVSGDIKNASGSVLNNGSIQFTGNWFNGDARKGFDARSTGKVLLTGDDQTIGGTQLTAFFDLELGGRGVKALGTNAEVLGQLNLSDRELNLNENRLTVINTVSEAIIRKSGFVNTDRGGKLLRNMASTNAYLFPFGSSAAGRYRPIEVIPHSAEKMSYAATMYNHDPSINGYDVTNKLEDIKSVFKRYFYIVDQVNGTGKSNIKFYLNGTQASSALASEGDVKQVVSWSNFKLWEKAPTLAADDGSFGDNLTRSLMYSATAPLPPTPFTFGDPTTPNDPLTFFNAFSPDGDGKNDTWKIHNIDLFPENELSIFNRWGDEVFKARNYSSATAWDGGSVNSGTYYYILKVDINGTTKSYKGFITMLKKD